jgi:hypothetical protein
MSGRERLESYLRENGVSFEVGEHLTAYTARGSPHPSTSPDAGSPRW